MRYPDWSRTDQGSVFTSARWNNLSEINVIEHHFSVVKSHSSLDVKEKYNEPLQRIYQKMRHSFLSVSSPYFQQVAVKATNDTIGEKGLIPARLVCVILPRFPILASELPNQKDLFEALKTT